MFESDKADAPRQNYCFEGKCLLTMGLKASRLLTMGWLVSDCYLLIRRLIKRLQAAIVNYHLPGYKLAKLNTKQPEYCEEKMNLAL